MELVEMMVVMGKDRMIKLPEEEVKVMGLKEGDELNCTPCQEHFELV